MSGLRRFGSGAGCTADHARRGEGARSADWSIAVPASSANLGPGFDTLAVALRLYLRLRVCAVLDGPTNGLQFDLCGTRLGGDNFVERSFRTLAAAERVEFPSLSLEVRSDIPVQGGLGSSAAATVAGLLLYERLAGPREGRDLLTLATRLDEHADNVAAALLGGLVTTCVRDDGRVIARAVRVAGGHPVRRREPGRAAGHERLAPRAARRGAPRRCGVQPAAGAAARAGAPARRSTNTCAKRCAIAGTSRSAPASCRGSPSCWSSGIPTCSASA